MIRLGYSNLWRILEVYKKAPAECNCIPAGAFCYTSDVRDFNLCRRCAEFRSYHTMFQTVVVNTILCHITAHIVGNRF